MIYDNYTQQFYNPRPQQQTSSIIWVQGENAAKAYPVLAGQSVLLMDSEQSVLYIKSTDQSGMPLPLRIFDYTERNQNGNVAPLAERPDYISREEFEKFREEIRNDLRRAKRREEPVKDLKNA